MADVGGVKAFHAEVASAARILFDDGAAEIGFGDLAAKLGDDFAHGGPSERKLRRCIDYLVDRDVLYRIDRGTYRPGTAISGELATGAALSHQIYRAFYKNGGAIHSRTLCDHLGRTDDNKARIVRSHLADDPRFIPCGPYGLGQGLWRLTDEEWRKVPLSGEWRILDLRITAHDAGIDVHRANWLAESLELHRQRIGLVLQQIRGLLGATIGEIIDQPEVKRALKAALRGPKLGSRSSIRWWWSQARDQHGERETLALAWMSIERPDRGVTPDIDFPDVGFWIAVANQANIDAAALSRGAIAR